MNFALTYAWVVPVAIGVAATYYFAMKDLKSDAKISVDDPRD